MKAFDEKATCPKCSHASVSITHQRRYLVGICHYGDCSADEHLHRRCQRCGYQWAEACIDASEASR